MKRTTINKTVTQLGVDPDKEVNMVVINVVKEADEKGFLSDLGIEGTANNLIIATIAANIMQQVLERTETKEEKTKLIAYLNHKIMEGVLNEK